MVYNFVTIVETLNKFYIYHSRNIFIIEILELHIGIRIKKKNFVMKLGIDKIRYKKKHQKGDIGGAGI